MTRRPDPRPAVEVGSPRWQRELDRDEAFLALGRVGLLASHLERAGVDTSARIVCVVLDLLVRDLRVVGPLSDSADDCMRLAWRVWVPDPAEVATAERLARLREVDAGGPDQGAER